MYYIYVHVLFVLLTCFFLSNWIRSGKGSIVGLCTRKLVNPLSCPSSASYPLHLDLSVSHCFEIMGQVSLRFVWPS